MQNIAYQTIKKYNMIQKGDSIIVGLSGGADSVSLFHLLCSMREEYKLTIIGVHIHHGIRGEDADADANYVERLCVDYHVNCEIFRYDIHKEAKKLKITDEEAGRLIRYKMFGKVLEKYSGNKIAVAHNMNDQAETVLMRLCRGTGLRGLTGISAVRDNIIRPLIECSRDNIEEYCKLNTLEYKTDYTNDMAIYTRNKIRLHLIPWIKENLNPAIVQTLSKMSGLLQEEEDYMALVAKTAYDSCECKSTNSQTSISIEKFKLYPSVIQKRVIRLVLQNFKQDLHDVEQRHILDVLKLMDKKTGKSINLTNGIIVDREYQNLNFTIKSETKNLGYCYTIEMNKKTIIEQANMTIKAEIKYKGFLKENNDNLYTKVFDYDKINDGIKVRTRLSGDKIYLKSSGNKKLKDFFMDIKLPRDQRDNVPLIATDNDIIWILGYRTNSQYDVTEATNKILYIECGFIRQ